MGQVACVLAPLLGGQTIKFAQTPDDRLGAGMKRFDNLRSLLR